MQRGTHAVADFEGVGGVDAEEDPQFFGGLSTCFDAFEAVVFFFVAEASFELGGALFFKCSGYFFALKFIFSRSSFAYKVSGDAVKGCVFAVGIGGVDGVCSGAIYFNSSKLLGFGDGILKLGAFVEGVEAEFLDEADAVDLDFIDFGAKFYFFGFFAADDGTDMGFVEADDSIFDGFACFEHFTLLLEHFFDRLSSDGKSVCVCDGVVCFDVIEDAIEFCEESKEGAGDPSALFFGFSAHACIFGVCLCPLVEFCAWKWNVRFLTDFLDVFVEVADAFPE